MLTSELFFKEFSKLCVLFNAEPSEPLIEIYYQALQDLQDDQFLFGVKTIIQTHKYNCLPKPAEFLELFTDREGDEHKAINALLKLEEGIVKHGYYDSVQFDDPRIHKAVEHMGGWMKVSSQEPEEWIWSRKEFINIYKALLHRPYDNSPTKLIGFIEQDNLNRGTGEKLLNHLRPVTHYIGSTKVVSIKNNNHKEIGGA